MADLHWYPGNLNGINIVDKTSFFWLDKSLILIFSPMFLKQEMCNAEESQIKQFLLTKTWISN